MRTPFLTHAIAALFAFAAPTYTSARLLDLGVGPGEMLVATVHAEGAQIYRCEADLGGKLTWQLLEPLATLQLNGEAVGRHYAGPSWEMHDGSAVSAKVTARAPGRTQNDIPLLLLEVTASRGTGLLSGVTTIHRLNTIGGVAQGECTSDGMFKSVPYSADYAFIRRAS